MLVRGWVGVRLLWLVMLGRDLGVEQRSAEEGGRREG